MEVTGGAEEAFVREWTPCSHILNLIPPRIQTGIFSSELCLTCVDAVSEYIALGTNVGLVYWYDRKKGNIQRLRCETSTSPITYVKIVSTVDYMVGAGNEAGQVTVFQIPKEHPDNVPDTFKPKVEPKVERYTIGDLHKSPITAIEWSKNGMRLFSGDRNGVIIMTEIDFYMHLCKSVEIVNEQHEIVQLSWCRGALLVASVYRTIVCDGAGGGKWAVSQIGKKDRKSLCALGAVFQYSYACGGEAAAYCARPGLRLWRADRSGAVQQTLLFKEAIANPLTVAELLNPAHRRAAPPAPREPSFGPLHVYREQFLVSHDAPAPAPAPAPALYVLDPRSLTAVAVVDQLRNILSVSVNKEEIFVLEGPRSLVRLAPRPERPERPELARALAPEETSNLMTKSLTTSIQNAVNTVRELSLAHIEQTVPYLSGALEHPIAVFTKNEVIDGGGGGCCNVVGAEECFELPPIKTLPNDISDNVLESIINEFKDVTSDVEEIRRIKSEELEKKLKLYNSIMEKKYDEEVIHSSRRSRRRGRGRGREAGSRSGDSPPPPRVATPVRKSEISYTSPCVMNVSVYGHIPQQSDDLLEKQIEEKEKILAKMLNLESLSINSANIDHGHEPPATATTGEESIKIYSQENVNEKVVDNPEPLAEKPKPFKKSVADNIDSFKPEKKPVTVKPAVKREVLDPTDLVPKVIKLPNTWNVQNLLSPDENLEAEWEII